MATLKLKKGKTQSIGFYVRHKENNQAKDLTNDTITWRLQDADTYATYLTKTTGSGIQQGSDGKGIVTINPSDTANLALTTYHFDTQILDADTNNTEPGDSGDLVLES